MMSDDASINERNTRIGPLYDARFSRSASRLPITCQLPKANSRADIDVMTQSHKRAAASAAFAFTVSASLTGLRLFDGRFDNRVQASARPVRGQVKFVVIDQVHEQPDFARCVFCDGNQVRMISLNLQLGDLLGHRHAQGEQFLHHKGAGPGVCAAPFIFDATDRLQGVTEFMCSARLCVVIRAPVQQHRPSAGDQKDGENGRNDQTQSGTRRPDALGPATHHIHPRLIVVRSGKLPGLPRSRPKHPLSDPYVSDESRVHHGLVNDAFTVRRSPIVDASATSQQFNEFLAGATRTNRRSRRCLPACYER